jgi:predicted nucleotidyltransferase
MTDRRVNDLPEPIHEMTRRLVQMFRPDRIILFGSYARGTAHQDSDADLLIVLPLDGSRRQRAVDMERALAGLGTPKDLVLATPEELERDRNLPGTLIRSALTEGVVLYERSR